MHIYPVPAFSDNYFWLIQPSGEPVAYIVDPGAAEPVYAALKTHGLALAGILITHHHHDHIDGATELSEAFNIPIYGPQSDKIPQITHHLFDGDKLMLGPICAEVMALPGHTRDHIGYFITPDNSQSSANQPNLFCGDTLFAAGCGRLFDGSAEQLFTSIQCIAQLPDNTLIYCAHEYTLSNIRFAIHIEPNNTDLMNRQSDAQQKRSHNQPTVPTLLSLEKQTNPFLRCQFTDVRERVEQITQQTTLTELEVFTSLRRLKDQF